MLHNFLAEIGCVDWARRREGFIFELLQQSKDPADAASKWMRHLFDRAGIDRATQDLPRPRLVTIRQDAAFDDAPETLRRQCEVAIQGAEMIMAT